MAVYCASRCDRAKYLMPTWFFTACGIGRNHSFVTPTPNHMNTLSGQNRSKCAAPVLLPACLILLASCGDSGNGAQTSTVRQAVDTPVVDTIESHISSAFVRPKHTETNFWQAAMDPSEDHPVDPTEFEQLKGNHYSKFGYKVGTTLTPFSKAEVSVLWSDLVKCMDSVTVVPPDIRGLLIHYGYDNGSHEFKAGFSIVSMIYNAATDEYDYDTTSPPFYVVNGTDQLKRAVRADWNATEKARYFQYVKVKRNPANGTIYDLDKNIDAMAYALPWEGELLYLGSQNAARVNASTRLVVSCTAEKARYSGSCWWRQHTAVNLRTGGIDVLDEHNYAGFPFRMKAADLGTPCPPRCKKFKFEDKSRLCL